MRRDVKIVDNSTRKTKCGQYKTGNLHATPQRHFSYVMLCSHTALQLTSIHFNSLHRKLRTCNALLSWPPLSPCTQRTSLYACSGCPSQSQRHLHALFRSMSWFCSDSMRQDSQCYQLLCWRAKGSQFRIADRSLHFPQKGSQKCKVAALVEATCQYQCYRRHRCCCCCCHHRCYCCCCDRSR